MNIYLTGFMGTGKTRVAAEIARIKKWKRIDIDELIEERQGQTIVEIFKQKGEPYFRGLEHQILQEISEQQNCVVSCGGGIVINPENITLMKKTGVMVCLTARIEIILERTRGFSHRPLLLVDNPREKIAQLLKEREPFYKQADLTIDTSDISVEEVARSILNSLSLL